MQKYFRIYKRFFENALSYEAQYRGNAVLSFFINFLWVGVLLITIETFFSHTQSLSGWSKGEMYILLLFWMLVEEIFIVLFNRNLQDISNHVTEGTLDLYLTKPANTLFLISTKYIHIRAIYMVISYLILFGITLHHFDLNIPWYNIFSTLLITISGLTILYSFVLLINTLSFWFYRIDNINELWFGFTEIGKYPLTVLPKNIRPLFFTLIPVAFSGYIPSLAFFSRLDAIYFIIIPTAALIFFLSAVSLFRYALKNYTSASS